MTEKQQQLGATLWKIADELRGAMNADDFRDYILSFLFLRYLSDNYLSAVKRQLGADYPDGESKSSSSLSPFAVWYRENEESVQRFEREMRVKVHYVIKPEFLWGSIAEQARVKDEELLRRLEEGFAYIENDSFESTFKGLFSEINLNSEKLGKTYSERNEKLCTIVSKINEGLSQIITNGDVKEEVKKEAEKNAENITENHPEREKENDILGDAYEYLIGEFAAGSGKKAGEFYTPQQVSSILSEIVILDSQDPSLGKKNKLDHVLDFACGSGSLLLNVKKKLSENISPSPNADKNKGKENTEIGGNIGAIYGQEKNITTYNLARMNMLLHRVKDSQFEIHHGDSLNNDWDVLSEKNPAKKITFDAIVANPPFSYRWEPSEMLSEDFRFKNYGIAPKSAADFAFLLHGFHFLSDEGTMAIILPHGVLFRGGAEERIRKKLLQDNSIDTVIGLAPNLFFSTGIPVCILVLKKCKKKEDVLFVNASEDFEKGKRQNALLPEHIDKIIQTYQFRKEEDRYSRKVSLKEIEENDYNLNISRYISTAKPEEQIDLQAVHQSLEKTEKNIFNFKKTHNGFLEELHLGKL